MDEIEFNFGDDDELNIKGIGDGEDDDIGIKRGSNKKKNQKVKIKKRTEPVSIMRQPIKTNFAPQPQPPLQQNPPQQPFTDRTFEAFANVDKKLPERQEEIESEDEEEGISNFGEEPMYGSDGGFGGEESQGDEPSPGFETIQDEKQDLLYKFHRLESKGIKLNKKFNLYSDINEMRMEYNNIKRDAETNSSVKFSRRMLLAVVSATEFLNKRYDPFSLELNGWSESVMENMNDGEYDMTFERLHEKYAGKVNTPPEIELMLSLAGSALMFHMTSTMFKNIPMMKDPNMMQNIMKEAMRQTGQQGQEDGSSFPSFNRPENDEPREPGNMRGPSIDLSKFGGMFGASSRNVGGAQVREIPESVLSDSGSETSMNSDIRRVSMANVSEGATANSRRGRKPKVIATEQNTIDI
tara:strand:- start:4342 stop:5571 length:1230 start_codon:yes stop_codon:yes gene_type:complete